VGPWRGGGGSKGMAGGGGGGGMKGNGVVWCNRRWMYSRVAVGALGIGCVEGLNPVNEFLYITLS